MNGQWTLFNFQSVRNETEQEITLLTILWATLPNHQALSNLVLIEF